MNWERTGKTVSAAGTTVEYRPVGAKNIPLACRFAIESRKRHIPHANGVGTWDHTSYFVILDGKDVVEKWSLKDAKAYVEGMINEGPDEPV